MVKNAAKKLHDFKYWKFTKKHYIYVEPWKGFSHNKLIVSQAARYDGIFLNIKKKHSFLDLGLPHLTPAFRYVFNSVAEVRLACVCSSLGEHKQNKKKTSAVTKRQD